MASVSSRPTVTALFAQAVPLLVALGAMPGCASVPWLTPTPETPPHPELVFEPAAELPAPEGLRATGQAFRSIPLKWDPLLRPDVAGYLIERATQSDGPFLPIVTLYGRSHLAHVDGGDGASLGDNDTRYYRLRAFSPEGRVAKTASAVAVATTAALPDPPEGLRAYSRQPREVPLSWTASADPLTVGYRLERSPSPEGPFETVADLDGRFATHHIDAGLGDLRVFYYRVAARNPGGDHGAPSPARRSVTKPEPLPPVGLRVVERRLGVNRLAWELNVETDIASYRLMRWIDGSPPELVTSVTAPATEARHLGVDTGESIRYALIAVDRDGLESLASEPIRASGVGYEVIASVGPDGVRIQWNPRAEEGFDGARVSRTGWLSRRQEATVSGGEFLDRNVVPRRTYSYSIQLLRADGDPAPASRPVTVEIP